MRLYGRKLVNYISFDSQLNVQFNAASVNLVIS